MRLLSSLRSTSICCRGYSLIELLIAAGVLATGLAAIASLTINSSHIEARSQQKARAIALAEAAATLWQLGQDNTNICVQLLGDPVITACEFTPLAQAVKTPAGATPEFFDSPYLQAARIDVKIKLGDSTQTLTTVAVQSSNVQF